MAHNSSFHCKLRRRCREEITGWTITPAAGRLWVICGSRWTEAGEPAGIGGVVEFRTDVFDAESIEGLVERLRRVLVTMTVDAGRQS